jgi:hypothetical protein
MLKVPQKGLDDRVAMIADFARTALGSSEGGKP